MLFFIIIIIIIFFQKFIFLISVFLVVFVFISIFGTLFWEGPMNLGLSLRKNIYFLNTAFFSGLAD